MRKFNLVRTEDASGVSGTGVVAEGVQFASGRVAMRWLTATASTAFYASIEDVVTIHGHEGRTTVRWVGEVIVEPVEEPTEPVVEEPVDPPVEEPVDPEVTDENV